MLNDLDVYVATSMRNRQDFRNMAETCERIFSDLRLKEMNLRYFDPTFTWPGHRNGLELPAPDLQGPSIEAPKRSGIDRTTGFS